MWDLAPQHALEYEGELLVPRINFAAYRQVYILESWLRRVCLAAWMVRFGRDWQAQLDPRLLTALSRRVTHNSQRVYLGAENDSELIWQTTHSELIQLIGNEGVAESIETLTGTSPGFLIRKLDEVREIRNLLAHNRALARRTYVILAGLLASLEEAVEHFRKHMLYGASDIMGDEDGDVLGSYLTERLKGNNWSQFQAFVSRKGGFVEYVTLPVAPFNRHVDARRLLSTFSEHSDCIVAFCLNKGGDEYIILTPERLPTDLQFALCDTFVKNPDVWTDVEYIQQDPRYICSPKIWFYEKESPFGREMSF